jgi:hypothetical protein
MALLWFDGFDARQDLSLMPSRYFAHRPAQYVTGRVGGSAKEHNADEPLTIFLDSPITTCITGYAILHYFINSSTGRTVDFLDGNTSQVYVEMSNATNQMRIKRGDGTTLATGSFQPIANMWYYVEFKATIHPTSGSVELRINGQTIASATNVNTRNSTANQITKITYGAFIFSWDGIRLDDLYINDGTGTSNNDFLGDVRVIGLFPNASGTYTQWSGSATPNWANVDEVPPNNDTDYNFTATVGNKDSYNLTDITISGTVIGVQVGGRFRKDDAGSATVRLFTLLGANVSNEATEIVLDTYKDYLYVPRTLDPAGNAWTVANVNALEVGIERMS